MNSQINIAIEHDENDDDANFMLSLQEERRLAAETLEKIGLVQASIPFDLWQEYSGISERFQFLLKENRYQVDGKPSEQFLEQVIFFKNKLLADLFIETLARKYPEFKVHKVDQPVECLEDHEVSVRHQVLMTTIDVTAAVCKLVGIAHMYLGEWETWHDVDDEPPQSVPTHLTWANRPRQRLRMRTEYLPDLLLARLVLAPYICRWEDVDVGTLMSNGEQRAVTSLSGHEAEFDLVDESVTLDQLRWLLNEVTDMHISSESLNYAHKYDGDRLKFSYFDRMTPPDDVRLRLAQNLDKVASTLEYTNERIDGLGATLVKPLAPRLSAAARASGPVTNLNRLDCGEAVEFGLTEGGYLSIDDEDA